MDAFRSLRLCKKERMSMVFMEIYLPAYILLLVFGACVQALYALCGGRRALPFGVAVLGACAVLGSAWLERDVVLAFGQIFLLCVLWRLAQDRRKTRDS